MLGKINEDGALAPIENDYTTEEMTTKMAIVDRAQKLLHQHPDQFGVAIRGRDDGLHRRINTSTHRITDKDQPHLTLSIAVQPDSVVNSVSLRPKDRRSDDLYQVKITTGTEIDSNMQHFDQLQEEENFPEGIKQGVGSTFRRGLGGPEHWFDMTPSDCYLERSGALGLLKNTKSCTLPPSSEHRPTFADLLARTPLAGLLDSPAER